MPACNLTLLLIHPATLDNSSFSYAMVKRLIASRDWEFLGKADGIEIYLDKNQEHLKIIGEKIKQLFRDQHNSS